MKHLSIEIIAKFVRFNLLFFLQIKIYLIICRAIKLVCYETLFSTIAKFRSANKWKV